MKALTVWQPYASLLVMGLKEFETRGWETKYRGPLVIHAAAINDSARKRDLDRVLDLLHQFGEGSQREKLIDSIDGTFGCAIGVVNMSDCKPMMDGGSDLENEVGFFGEGRFGWKCDNPRMFASPIPMIGKQRIWYINADLEEAVESATKGFAISDQ